MSFWSQLGGDIDGEASEDYSGYSVSLSADGNTVAIGAIGNDGNGSTPYSGHVRVYKYINNVWTQRGADIDGEAIYDYSGYSVSLSADGNTVAIGAPYKDGKGTDSGHVRVYKYINNVWNKLGSDIDGEAIYDFSGYSVSLSADGNTVAIGADGNNGNGTNSGHVRVYEYSNNVWTQRGSDIDGEASEDYSGYSVSLSADGNTVAIGAVGNDGNGSTPYSGHVRVYGYINNVWTQRGSDIDGEASSDQSGYSVSLSADGNTVAIGAVGNDGNGTDSGHVRVYKYINNVWTQRGADIDGEAIYDNSGYSVSLSADGNTVAIGAFGNDGNGTDSGHVRVYKYINNVWTQRGSDIDGEAIYDNSGYSVSLSADGNTVAIGAPYSWFGGVSYPGYVRVYKLSDDLISNICFIAGTPVTTDQCNIPIEKIDTSIHTIRNKKIVAITKTVTQDKYLVCFEKDALGKNIPSQKTTISKNHKLFYNGKMRMAKEFLKDFSNVVKVKYTKQLLYNVLLEEHDKMLVNNLICETLHPENGVAKVYMALQNLDTEDQQLLIQKINAHVIKNNVFNGNKKLIK